MKKVSLIIVLIVSLMLSCKNEKVYLSDINNVKKIFPVSENYWYRYLYLTLDKTGKIYEDSTTVMLMKVVNTETLLNKKAYVFHVIDSLGRVLSVQKYALDNNKIYLFSNLINDLVDDIEKSFSVNLPIKIGSDWLLMADPQKKEWIAYEKNIDSNFINSGCRLVGKLSILGKQGSIKNIGINNEIVPSKEYILVYQFNGFEINDKNENYKIGFAINLHTWFGLNTGILESFVEPTFVDLHYISFPYGGYKDKVIEYHIE